MARPRIFRLCTSLELLQGCRGAVENLCSNQVCTHILRIQVLQNKNTERHFSVAKFFFLHACQVWMTANCIAWTGLIMPDSHCQKSCVDRVEAEQTSSRVVVSLTVVWPGETTVLVDMHTCSSQLRSSVPQRDLSELV